MKDETIINRINHLVAEEDALHGPRDPLTERDRQRRAEIEAELDQCYDLLRQRRARRRVGEDPDEAEARSAEQVETYAGEDGGPPL